MRRSNDLQNLAHGELSTVERVQVEVPAFELPGLVLEVASGADAGRVLALDSTLPARIHVGRSAACHLTLDDPLVSRRHATLSLEPGCVRITDLESANGTWVNDLRIVETFLTGGETLRFADTIVRVGRASQPHRVRLTPSAAFGRLIGASVEMRRLYPILERLALSDLPVVVEGETGTGKELLAEALHEASPRANGPFVVFDCTTAPSSLVESELFGHERGAYTGADGARAGVFEQANGGTLLIDEIGDLDLALQAKLLRAVQSGQIKRLGGSKYIQVDVRLIAATRRDLEREIQAGRFRDDLYYRLAVARVELPPLRRRYGDVALLAERFWSTLVGSGEPLPPELLERLQGYPWPGNVRELHNVVAHRAAMGALAESHDGRRRSLPPPGEPSPRGEDVVDQLLAEDLPFPEARRRILATFEDRYVERVLARHAGNVSKAAAASGIARRYFYVIQSRRGR